MNVILTRGGESIFTKEKHTSTPYSVALVIQHAIRMRRNRLSSVAFLALPYFSTFSHKPQDFREKFLNTKCMF